LQDFTDKDQKLYHRRLALQLDDKEYFKFKNEHAWKTMEWCQNHAKASGFPENEYLRHSNRALNSTMMRPETTTRSQRVLSDTKEVTDKMEDAQESPQLQEDSGSFQAKQSRKRSRGQEDEDEDEETGNTSKRRKRARPSPEGAARPAGRTVQSQRQRKEVPDEMEDIQQSPEPEERSGSIQPKRSRKRARDQEDEGDQDESTSDKRKRARTTPEEASCPAQKTVQP
jgi:hypothetical protein